MTSPSFPAALDALANPGPTTETDDAGFELDIVVARLQNCIMAIENKLGIGVGGPPATPGVLRRTATGSSGWGTVTAAEIAPSSFPQLIQTQTLAAAGTVITLPTIDQTYKHLELRIFGRSSAAAAIDVVTLRYNSDASGIYHGQLLTVNAATATASEHPPGSTYASLGNVPAASSAGAEFGAITTSIPAYTSTAGYKRLTSQSHHEGNNLAGQSVLTLAGMSWYGGPTPVTLIQLGLTAGQFVAGTIVSLYGWN